MKAAEKLASLFLSAAALGVCGCPKCPDTSVPLAQLVAEHNANAARVGRLWARAKIAVTFMGKESGLPFSWGSTSPLASPNGLLLLAKGPGPLGPHDFALIGRELGRKLFQLGSSVTDGRYYLWYNVGDRSAGWWGRNELAGAPGVVVPIDPNQLLAVLAVCELPSDFTAPPTVAVRMSTNPCAYVVTYIDRQPVTGKIIFKRDMYFRWSDSKPRRAFLVNFFDAAGRLVMTARLKNYRSVEVEDKLSPPVMPTDIEINWPQTRGKIHLVLSQMTTADKWRRSACRATMPDNIPPDRIFQIDEFVSIGGDGK
ncbi:MAG: hypothetical protein KAU28_10355 [Phycisphaerae bacterium]|nr:hypothetical protein [Phycisphaerae bacterium]